MRERELASGRVSLCEAELSTNFISLSLALCSRIFFLGGGGGVGENDLLYCVFHKKGRASVASVCEGGARLYFAD